MQVIKTKQIVISLVITGMFILIAGCNFSSKRHYEVLTLEGASFASNLSNSSMYLGSESLTEENPELKLIVSPGDLIFVLGEDDSEFYYRIKENDEDFYTFTTEEEPGGAIKLSDTPIAFTLTKNDSSWMQFNASDPTVIDRLSYIELDFQVSEKQIAYLEQFSGYYRDIGLILLVDDQPGLLNRLLPILQPEWLILLDSDPSSIEKEAATHLANLEMLWISGDMTGANEFLSYCPNLKQLIISEWKPEHGNLDQLKNLQKISSLTLTEYAFTDLSNFEFPSSLSCLHISSLDLTDISGLKTIPNLISLSLTGCDEITDLSFINNLPDLQYLSFPPNTTQEEFDQIIQDQRKLEVIELNECEDISNLTLLKDQLKLKALILNSPDIDLAQLHALDHPELIILEREYFKEQPDAIEALQAALPETDIYPGGAFCLGSGWILLLLPFLLTIRYIAYLKQRNK